MDDFWKYLIVANNIAMVWILYTSRKNSNTALNKKFIKLERCVLENAKIDTEFIKTLSLVTKSQSERINMLQDMVINKNHEQSENVDVKDS